MWAEPLSGVLSIERETPTEWPVSFWMVSVIYMERPS